MISLQPFSFRHPTLQSLTATSTTTTNQQPTNNQYNSPIQSSQPWPKLESTGRRMPNSSSRPLRRSLCKFPTYPTAYCSPLRVSCLPVLTIQTARLPVCTLNLTFSTPQFMNTNIYLLSSRVYATEGYGFLLVKFVCVCFPSY